MSGRSAYVRKKITETKSGDRADSRSRPKSNASSDNATIGEHPVGGVPGPRADRDWERDITGPGTANARSLKFSQQTRDDEALAYRNGTVGYENRSSGSQSGSSLDGRREGAATSHLHRPLEDFAYARARRPVVRTEDMSGIEKSGLRTVLDKKSDEVRRGLVKAFTFKKKDRKEHDADGAIHFRPQSSATVRPTPGADSHPNQVHDGYRANGWPARHPDEALDIGLHSDELPSPQISSQLPPISGGPDASQLKRWIGAGRPVQRWNKLRKDPELWDPNGDVLVYFGQRGQSPRIHPSFRLSSHIIEATESRYLITLLREGSTEEDVFAPPSPAGAPLMLRHDYSLHGHGQNSLAPGGFGNGGQPTPPVSDNSLWEADGQISYEMYFPTPLNATRLDQLRHHITTRNVFALLYHASLVGLSLYQALSDLHSRLESYMPPEADNVGTIINYLTARGMDDVRNDPETAVSLLAWSECSEVRWEEGWRECFLHCAGMYSRLEKCSDFNQVTPITRALLERASLEMQLRVQAAEERLAAFQYNDMWPSSVAILSNTSGPVVEAPAKMAADRLQRFFVQYYTREFGSWPPPPRAPVPRGASGANMEGEEDEDLWLTRTVAQMLQRDFAALYDYLVNRDIVWDGSEARSSRKWLMVSESGNRGFEADLPELPVTDMLIEFDNRHRLPHIPHPYPLVPESIPPLQVANGPSKESSTSGKFGGKSTKKNGSGSAATGRNGRAGALERRIQLAYTEATNICVLGPEFTHSALIDAFAKFEKTDHIGEIDPALARCSRWVLIYGILQTLASVSVDAPNVRYRDGVAYHLSPRLKGARIPPWRTGHHHHHHHHHHHPPQEATHELSHCWTVPATWNAAGVASASNSGAESSAEEGADSGIGDYGYGGRSYAFPMPRASRKQQQQQQSQQQRNPQQRAPSRLVRGSGTSRAPSTYAPPFSFNSAVSVVSLPYSEGETTGSSSIHSPTTPPSSALPPTPGRSRRGRGPAAREGTSSLVSSVAGPGGDPGPPGGYVPPPASAPLGANRVAMGLQGQGFAGGVLLGLDELMDDDDWNRLSRGDGNSNGAGSDVDRDRERRGKGRGRGGAGGSLAVDRPLMGGGGGAGTGTDSVGLVIRDFDDLDVIDDHAP